MHGSNPPQHRRTKKPSARGLADVPGLLVPLHRRLPSYKRTGQRYSRKAWAPPKEWAKAEERWLQHDIQPSAIYNVLRQSVTARMDYEDDLAIDLEFAEEEPAYRRFIRGLNQRLEIVFTWLDQHREHPEAHVAKDLLRKTLGELSEELASLAPQHLRMFKFKGRPGEPWLKPTVTHLFKIFRGHGIGRDAARREILEALALAGHRDVVNLPLIKRLTRGR